MELMFDCLNNVIFKAQPDFACSIPPACFHGESLIFSHHETEQEVAD